MEEFSIFCRSEFLVEMLFELEGDVGIFHGIFGLLL